MKKYPLKIDISERILVKFWRIKSIDLIDWKILCNCDSTTYLIFITQWHLWYFLCWKTQSIATFDCWRLPFNWRTPFGYLIALCIECMAVFSIILTTIPLVCFFIGSCWLCIAFAKDITNDLSLWNLGGLTSNQSHLKCKMKLCRIVEIHSDVKQLSVQNAQKEMPKCLTISCIPFRFVDEFSSAYELMIPGVYLWLLSTFCVVYLMVYHRPGVKFNVDFDGEVWLSVPLVSFTARLWL